MTNKLLAMLEETFTKKGAIRDAHHPEVVVYYATQSPSRSMFLEGKGPSFVEDYISVGKKLTAAGATMLCMPCNTAHFALDEIESAVGVPFINIIKNVGQRIQDAFPHKTVGLIASDGCLAGKVYERVFDVMCPDIKLIYPDKAHQSESTRGICNVKNVCRFLPLGHPDRPKTIFTCVCEHLRRNGAEVIVTGCTDISVDFSPQDFSEIEVIDSLQVLSDACWGYLLQDTP